MSLTQKLALVTGGGSGIGRATCQILARDGADVISADINLPSAQQTIDSIKTYGRKNMSLKMDVSDSSTVTSALDQILKKYGKPPSIVVNCAGIFKTESVLEMTEENFQRVLDVNLKGTFLVMQTFSKAIIEHKIPQASIVNISSVASKLAMEGLSSYCASKAGVVLMTKTAVKEFGNNGIRVNCILPGAIDTPMLAIGPEDLKKAFFAQIPMGRFGQPEEIAEVVSFLASEKSSYISGATIEVNGGIC